MVKNITLFPPKVEFHKFSNVDTTHWCYGVPSEAVCDHMYTMPCPCDRAGAELCCLWKHGSFCSDCAQSACWKSCPVSLKCLLMSTYSSHSDSKHNLSDVQVLQCENHNKKDSVTKLWFYFSALFCSAVTEWWRENMDCKASCHSPYDNLWHLLNCFLREISLLHHHTPWYPCFVSTSCIQRLDYGAAVLAWVSTLLHSNNYSFSQPGSSHFSVFPL